MTVAFSYYRAKLVFMMLEHSVFMAHHTAHPVHHIQRDENPQRSRYGYGKNKEDRIFT